MYDMGRKLTIENLSLIHPIIYLSFAAAGFAASMAVITALCGMGFRRKPESTSDSIELGKDLDTTSISNTETENNNNDDNNNNEEQIKELPLPPAMAAMQHPKDPFISDRMKRVTSERKLPISLSIKMPRSLSMARNWDHKEERNKGNIEGKLKAEDSVWMKTIILGEKCNPDEENDPVIYEGRGKRIAAYHTKRQGTVSMFRQNSSHDIDVVSLTIPQTQTQTQEERKNDTLSR